MRRGTRCSVNGIAPTNGRTPAADARAHVDQRAVGDGKLQVLWQLAIAVVDAAVNGKACTLELGVGPGWGRRGPSCSAEPLQPLQQRSGSGCLKRQQWLVLRRCTSPMRTCSQCHAQLVARHQDGAAAEAAGRMSKGPGRLERWLGAAACRRKGWVHLLPIAASSCGHLPRAGQATATILRMQPDAAPLLPAPPQQLCNLQVVVGLHAQREATRGRSARRRHRDLLVISQQERPSHDVAAAAAAASARGGSVPWALALIA